MAQSAPSASASGITFAVGAAPAQAGTAPPNEPVIAYSFAEAKEKLGYSDDWETYTLCEVMYTHLSLYKTGPVVFVNVLDPAEHVTTVTDAAVTLAGGKAALPLAAVLSTVEVDEGALGTDYELAYADGALVLSAVPGGALDALTSVTVSYDAVDPSAVTSADVVGGYDAATGKASGAEAVHSVFAKCGVVTDVLIAPGWSHIPAVANALAGAAESVNTVFKARAVVDGDASASANYAAALAKKNADGAVSPRLLYCWPNVSLNGKISHLSTHCAALLGTGDAENGGYPYVSPSNHALQADRACLADGTEVLTEVAQANALNGAGILTALNIIGGFRLWGNCTAAGESEADLAKKFIGCARMCDWLGNTQVLTFWSKLDGPLTLRTVNGVVDSLNIMLNGLAGAGVIYGGETAYIPEENPESGLIAGRIALHTEFASPISMQQIDFDNEFAVRYITAALAQ
jgi:phage tail sheath protein FI